MLNDARVAVDNARAGQHSLHAERLEAQWAQTSEFLTKKNSH